MARLSAADVTDESMMSIEDPSMTSVQDRLNCAQSWLNRAINLHQMHFKNPKVADDPTQTEMLDQMIRAYMCIAGDNASTDTNDAAQARLDCARSSMSKAIELHQMHMADPEMAKNASQIELMNQMASAYQCITGERNEGIFINSTSQSKINCARFWLDRAMRLHEMHIEDPTTATNDSQMVLMVQIEKAHECVSGETDESYTIDTAEEAKLGCALPWLEKAVRLHQMHIDDPSTATDESQTEMMDQMAEALKCLGDIESMSMGH